jgi:peptide/nickel transport system substrate-binding protein
MLAVGTRRTTLHPSKKSVCANVAVPDLVAKAYAFLDSDMPFIPLVQSPRIIPFNTTYWTGWPVAGGDSVPLHGWAAMQNVIHRLRKAN